MKNILPKSELLLKKSKPIDKLSTDEAILLMADEQQNAALEVKKANISIEYAINQIYKHLSFYKKGRLIYVGAGTSGRIGVQDGVELLPTFNWPFERVDFIIAGGHKAIVKAIENAEDDIKDAVDEVKRKSINSKDVIIGLAASGDTPFTCKVLEESFDKQALTIAISNNPNGKILNFGKIRIILDTKEEVVAGSTRLKAGTAQKICLNIISTLVMAKMGRVKNGYMNELVVTNEKLRQRKKSIDKEIKKLDFE
jgi:N-acetylmuramic acid 6-phosphate etherase